jgi:hypothetical protein
MSAADSVVVTYREVERILLQTEAAKGFEEAAKSDPTLSDLQRATRMAATGHVLTQLRKAEREARPNVLNSPQDALAARFQSLIASGAGGELKLAPLPAGGLEAKFDTKDWAAWGGTWLWAKLFHIVPHAMVRPQTTVANPLPESARIAVLGDWGTDLYGAPKIARQIKKDKKPYSMLLHLGDVYYTGTNSEEKSRFLDNWPYRKEAINRALNSNHEMYSGGDAYFEEALPKFGQDGSYFAYQNKHWTLVGLDVAYRDHAIDDEQVEWLRTIIRGAGDRRLVLFSHHQLYSHFESQGDKLWNHPGFGAILKSKRVFAWYWGHEHRCAIFENRDERFGLFGRCIGHSGMPQSRDRTRNLPRAAEWGAAEWRRQSAAVVAGNQLPSCLVLDGPNPYILNEEDKFSPNGYAVLNFDGPKLTEEVRSADGLVIYQRVLAT